MSRDPRGIISESPMSRFQLIAVAITISLNALDGFDVLSISFASPGIAAEWGIDRAALGFVLAMELIGMGVGSLTLGGLADRIGRRPMIIACLTVMATGMLLCTTANDVVALSVWRVLTGLGIGGMIAAINAMATEYASERRRDLAVCLLGAGYPVGAVIGGSIAAVLLRHYDWRSVFLFGGTVTALFIPLVLWRVPESIAFLVQKRPPNALKRVNAILARMGHDPVDALPEPSAEERDRSSADIFKPGLVGVTIAITLAYFLHMNTFYFILKWIPKIVADMGFAPASAAEVLVWANVGGATGSITLGLLAQRFGVKPITIAVLLMSTLMVALFGRTANDLEQLMLVCALIGVFANAGMVGLYAIVVRAFPTHVRATGTGFVIGIGRAGAALAPIIAGYLFQAGFERMMVALIMGAGSIVAAGALLSIQPRESGPSRAGARGAAETT